MKKYILSRNEKTDCLLNTKEEPSQHDNKTVGQVAKPLLKPPPLPSCPPPEFLPLKKEEPPDLDNKTIEQKSNLQFYPPLPTGPPPEFIPIPIKIEESEESKNDSKDIENTYETNECETANSSLSLIGNSLDQNSCKSIHLLTEVKNRIADIIKMIQNYSKSIEPTPEPDKKENIISDFLKGNCNSCNNIQQMVNGMNQLDSKPDEKETICTNFPRGNCTRQNLCKYVHQLTNEKNQLNSVNKIIKNDSKDIKVTCEPHKKEIVCRDFLRGNCMRKNSCKYVHKLTNDRSQLENVYKFCHDFQNSRCKLINCRYVHASLTDQMTFYRTGRLPPHLMKQIRKRTLFNPTTSEAIQPKVTPPILMQNLRFPSPLLPPPPPPPPLPQPLQNAHSSFQIQLPPPPPPPQNENMAIQLQLPPPPPQNGNMSVLQLPPPLPQNENRLVQLQLPPPPPQNENIAKCHLERSANTSSSLKRNRTAMESHGAEQLRNDVVDITQPNGREYPTYVLRDCDQNLNAVLETEARTKRTVLQLKSLMDLLTPASQNTSNMEDVTYGGGQIIK